MHRLGPKTFYATGVHLLPFSAVEDQRRTIPVKDSETLGKIREKHLW